MDAGSNRSVPLTELLFGKISNLPSKSAVTAPVDRRTESGSEWQPGKVEAAGTGTLYIDEIAAFNLEDQAALLEAINQRQYTPLRGRKSRPLSCRIIFGTAQRLDQAVQRGTFLKEFYHNFSIFPIYLPSLSERAEDVPALIYHFLRRYSQRYDREISRVDERLMTRLIARRWALNVRELADCVDKMIVVCDGDTLELRHYQEVMEEGGLEPRLERTPNTTRELIEAKKRLRRIAVAEVERAFVTRALQKSDGNVTLAARRVGMQRRNFQTLMRQHGVKAG
jgi:DNA-binding NtrC family response regulator